MQMSTISWRRSEPSERTATVFAAALVLGLCVGVLLLPMQSSRLRSIMCTYTSICWSIRVCALPPFFVTDIKADLSCPLQLLLSLLCCCRRLQPPESAQSMNSFLHWMKEETGYRDALDDESPVLSERTALSTVEPTSWHSRMQAHLHDTRNVQFHRNHGILVLIRVLRCDQHGMLIQNFFGLLMFWPAACTCRVEVADEDTDNNIGASEAAWRQMQHTARTASWASPSGPPKIALLFLARGPMPHDHLWERFIR